MAGRTRRTFPATPSGGDLVALGADLRRLRSRCRRLERAAQGDSEGTAWERWSAAVDTQNALFVEIARTPVATIEDVAVRYEALAMELVDGDLIVELGARRRLIALRRELRGLLTQPR